MGNSPLRCQWLQPQVHPRGNSESPVELISLFVEETGHLGNTQTPRREPRVGIKPTNLLGGDGPDHRATKPPPRPKQSKGKNKSNFSPAVNQPASHAYPLPFHLRRMKKGMSSEERGIEKKGRGRAHWRGTINEHHVCSKIVYQHDISSDDGWVWFRLKNVFVRLLRAKLVKSAVWTCRYAPLFQQIDLMSTSFRGSHDIESKPLFPFPSHWTTTIAVTTAQF